MDSSNSGSTQSSSGGGDDQEYDSRPVDSAMPISPFLSNNQNPMFLSHVMNGPISNNLSSSSPFEPLSSFLDPSLSRSHFNTINPTSSLVNFDMAWSKNPRSDPNFSDLGPGYNHPPPITNPQRPETSTIEPNSDTNTNANSNNSVGVVRNPKKRSRASRKAPTTVLTTDTTNFRAMVQEFTGIPAPPFTSSFPRVSRLDLFGTTSTLLTPPPPPYLLRPFPQKIQQPPPFLSPPPPPPLANSSFSLAIASTSTSATKTSTTTATPTPSDLGLLKQQQQQPIQNLLLNISQQQQQHNPVPNVQSLLSSSLQYPPSNDSCSHIKVGVLEELGLGHGHLNANNLAGLHQSFTPVPSSSSPETATMIMRRDNNNNGSHGTDHSINRPISESYSNSQRVNTGNGKVSLSGTGSASSSSLGFHGEKGLPENNVDLGARSSEGIMESWICSSD